MRRHIAYARYVFRHRWFVMLACFRYGLWWRGLKHDWSKFLPCEWKPYARSFYNRNGTKRTKLDADSEGDAMLVRQEFDAAWNHHQKVNDHHWQHWTLITDEDEPRYRPLPMPEACIREMVADWVGAGRAITGKVEVCAWYSRNAEKMLLHPDTRKRVEYLLQDWQQGRFMDEIARHRIRVLGY